MALPKTCPRPHPLAGRLCTGRRQRCRAHIVAKQFQLNTKETMVVDRKPGGGSALATAEMARARPNGSVLLLGSVGGQAIAPSLYNNLPYNAVKGVQPV